MKSKNDQVVAGPAVVFATQHAADKVVGDLKALFSSAAHYAEQQGTQAIQKGEEIRQLQKEINERQAWVLQKKGEMDQLDNESRHARDTAKGYADLLAQAGVHIPPYGGELSHNPDAAIDRLGAAHEELNRSGGHS